MRKLNLLFGLVVVIMTMSFSAVVYSASLTCGQYSLTGAIGCLGYGQTGRANANSLFSENSNELTSSGGNLMAANFSNRDQNFISMGEFSTVLNNAFWSTTNGTTVIDINQQASVFEGHRYVALGIKQAQPWSIFLVDLTQGTQFTFNANDISNIKAFYLANPPSEVPLPAAAWLFLSGLAGMAWIKRRKVKQRAMV